MDDRSACVQSHKTITQQVNNTVISTLKSHSKQAGLVLNHEKTKIFDIHKKPLQVQKFLGPRINNFLTAKNESLEIQKNILSAINAVRASNSLNYTRRLFITREKIFSCLTHLVFVYAYSPSEIKKLEKTIVLAFKKATYTNMLVSSKDIIMFLFGIDFESYCKYRLMNMANSMILDGNDLFSDIKKGRNGKLILPGHVPKSDFVDMYIKIFNEKKIDAIASIIKNSKQVKKLFFSSLLKNNAQAWKRTRSFRKRKEILQEPSIQLH